MVKLLSLVSALAALVAVTSSGVVDAAKSKSERAQTQALRCGVCSSVVAELEHGINTTHDSQAQKVKVSYRMDSKGSVKSKRTEERLSDILRYVCGSLKGNDRYRKLLASMMTEAERGVVGGMYPSQHMQGWLEEFGLDVNDDDEYATRFHATDNKHFHHYSVWAPTKEQQLKRHNEVLPVREEDEHWTEPNWSRESDNPSWRAVQTGPGFDTRIGDVCDKLVDKFGDVWMDILENIDNSFHDAFTRVCVGEARRCKPNQMEEYWKRHALTDKLEYVRGRKEAAVAARVQRETDAAAAQAAKEAEEAAAAAAAAAGDADADADANADADADADDSADGKEAPKSEL